MRWTPLLIASIAVAFLAQPHASSQVSNEELLKILKIHTWRIRVPNGPHGLWDIVALKKEQLHVPGENPQGLTGRADYLLALREVEKDKVEFTLPELKGFSQGIQNLCELGADCEGQYSIKWESAPRYSADGTQCVIGELQNTFGNQQTLFIALMRVRNTPD